jgi:hypothetical protein
VHVAQSVVQRAPCTKAYREISAVSCVARTLQVDGSMAEVSTLPRTFEATLKQTFRSFTVDMVPTTDGRRAIRLVAHGGPALVVGFADFGSQRAELCTIGHALSLSKEQIGREVRLPPVEYLRFLERATMVLEDFGMKVSVVTHAARSAPPPPAALPTNAASLIGAVAWLIAQ